IFSERWHGGTYPDRALRFADLDQDGAPELIALAQFVLVVYKQLPDGSWSELTRLELDESTNEMVVTDLTGDGLPDLALLEGTATLRAATGTGDGNFTLLESTTVLPTDSVNLYPLSLPGGGPAGLLVTYTVDETFSLYTYQLDGGTLLFSHVDSLADDPMHLALADLDHDGGDDLVALTRADDDTVSLVILPGTIDGFAAPRSRALSPLIPDLSTSTRLVLGDLDLDGTIDALLLDTPRIARLLDIAADAPPPPQLVDDALTAHARTGVIADADADGRPDLAYCSSDGLTIVLATADDRWAAQPAFDSYFDICALHVDPDTLRPTAALGDSGAVTILTPDLAPALAPVGYFSGGPAPFTSLVTGDLDADGNLDIVLAASANSDTPTGSTAVLWGSPDGRPRGATWSDGRLFGGALPLLAPLDDRPGDELVLAWYDGTIEILTATDHALEPGTVAHTDLYGPAAVAVQARADGPADVLLLARSGDPWTAVALSRASDGSFLPGDPVPLWTGPAGDATPFLTLADLDADGFADIVVSAGTNNPVVLLWGDEQRTPTPVTLPAPAGTYNITAADMDGDGRPELILGTIDGVLGLTFRDREPQPLITYLRSTSQDGLLVADLESDGHADLLRRDGESLNVTLRAPARADALLQLSVPPTWQQLHAADLDSDGILDLLGLQDGDLVTRLSAPQTTEAP
ncbi:MAG: VCBS repeat-containing protein, partial [Myxococcales bacterium]|nr:VCBS repeat-containing protein [Myxococcales bacterium]